MISIDPVCGEAKVHFEGYKSTDPYAKETVSEGKMQPSRALDSQMSVAPGNLVCHQ